MLLLLALAALSAASYSVGHIIGLAHGIETERKRGQGLNK